MTTDQLVKLPKWLQSEIGRLQMQRDAAVQQLNEFTDRQTKSFVWVEGNPCTGEERGPTSKRYYIQDDCVTFQLGKEHREIDVRLDRDRTRLVVSGARGTLSISPSASNVVYVRLEDW